MLKTLDFTGKRRYRFDDDQIAPAFVFLVTKAHLPRGCLAGISGPRLRRY
jgi:hypothetical protein